MEQNSLKALYQLVVHCCECLSLWKLLCEYQLHLTAKDLSPVRAHGGGRGRGGGEGEKDEGTIEDMVF